MITGNDPVLAFLRGQDRRLRCTDENCPGKAHGPSNRAWRMGCRSAAAIATHEQFIGERKATREAARAAGMATGKCAATAHGSQRAVLSGCICAPRRERVRTSRPRAAMTAEQRTRWIGFRGPAMHVNHVNLLLLMGGFRDGPTRGEYMAATHLLKRRGNPAGTGIMTHAEVGARLGVDDRAVKRYADMLNRMREQRHIRRWLDVKAKAERVAKATRRREGR